MKKLALLALPLLITACSSSVKVEEKVKYKCGNEIISTAFFDDESMMIIVDGSNHVLTRNVAASGAKYESINDGIIFWNKGDENYLEIRGQGYPNCRPIVD